MNTQLKNFVGYFVTIIPEEKPRPQLPENIAQLIKDAPKDDRRCSKKSLLSMYKQYAEYGSAEAVKIYTDIRGKLQADCHCYHDEDIAKVCTHALQAAETLLQQSPASIRHDAANALMSIASDVMHYAGKNDQLPDRLMRLGASFTSQEDYEVATLLFKPKFVLDEEKATPPLHRYGERKADDTAVAIFQTTSALMNGYRAAAVSALSCSRTIPYGEKLDRIEKLLNGTGYKGNGIQSIQRQRARLNFSPDEALLNATKREWDWKLSSTTHSLETTNTEGEKKRVEVEGKYTAHFAIIAKKFGCMPIASDPVTRSVYEKIEAEKRSLEQSREHELELLAGDQATKIGALETQLAMQQELKSDILAKIKARTLMENEFIEHCAKQWVTDYKSR